jgi:hypothetical protein
MGDNQLHATAMERKDNGRLLESHRSTTEGRHAELFYLLMVVPVKAPAIRAVTGCNPIW